MIDFRFQIYDFILMIIDLLDLRVGDRGYVK